jgi:cystathionine beta-lyase/cystathionine gamma-synthase
MAEGAFGPLGFAGRACRHDRPGQGPRRRDCGRDAACLAETPSNPHWHIYDIANLAEIAHGAGARLVVDNTVATPILTQPIKLGADIVVHSATNT